MRLATIRTAAGTRAVRIDDEQAVETGHSDLGVLLGKPNWREQAATARGPSHDRSALDYAPVVPRPGKIICVGVNYAAHIAEMGRDTPPYPTLFAKYAEALVGAYDDIVLPSASDAVDWEAELAVVIGAPARRVDESAAELAIAGYAVLNDVTARDWQYRTLQWLQGKTFETTTPIGPELVTADEAGSGLDLRCEVDGEVVQTANTDDLVFGATTTIAYVSTILTLRPGDIIALGTPGGVGHARKPPRYLQPGQTLTTSIAGLGQCGTPVSPGSEHTTVTRPPASAWCTDGERFLDEALDRLPGVDPDGPSLLPGWSRRTVIAHVARNADALCNLLTWARTGVETPMYASTEARETGIAATAQFPLASLDEDCRAASRRFAAAVNGLPEPAWDVEVRTAQGRTVPASQAVWMRCREVWVHAVDLHTGKGFDDIPDHVLVALIDDVTAMWARRDQTPDARFSAGDRHWGTGKVVVTADLADLARYVTGRHVATGDRPNLPPWL